MNATATITDTDAYLHALNEKLATLEKIVDGFTSTMKQSPQDSKPLYAALAKARAEVKPVEKDGKTSGGGSYTFASAAAIFEASGPLLAKHGLSVLNTNERIDEGAMMFYAEYLLTHESGAQMILTRETPIVIVKYASGSGTARDKAVGAARTVTERYLYRGLLCIPAVDANEEIDKRNDDGEYQGGNRRNDRNNDRGRRQERSNERREEPADPPPTGDQKPAPAPEPAKEPEKTETEADREARRAEMRQKIAKRRSYLGDALCKQLGFDKEPRTMQDAGKLLEALDAACRKKKATDEARAGQQSAQASTGDQKPAPAPEPAKEPEKPAAPTQPEGEDIF